MQPMANTEQFRQEAQQLIQRIDEKMNDLANSGYNSNQQTNQHNNEEINRLKTQREQLRVALERYGNESESNWANVQSEAQYTLEEVSNNWTAGTNHKNFQSTEENKWQRSTGQSEQGESGVATGLGDRAGMENPQKGLDNDTQHASFGNPQEGEATTSYEQIQASDWQDEEGDQEGLSRTNRGGEATQDDPGGSADKGDQQSDYTLPRTQESDKNKAGNRPWDSRSI